MKTINTVPRTHYFHSTCWHDMPERDAKIYKHKMSLLDLSAPEYQNLNFKLVKFPVEGNSISFIECPDFDADTEPVVGRVLTISLDIHAKSHFKIRTYNNHVYHKKYLFVNEGYRGFDFWCDRKYNQNMEIAMQNLGIDKRRIGNKKYWESIRPIVLKKSLELTFGR